MTGDYVATEQRRGAIVGQDNPAADRDYLISLLLVPPDGAGWRGLLQLVPDRLIVAPDGLTDYLDALASLHFGSLEQCAATVFDDLNNELVPRWLCLTLTGAGRSVRLQDSQPNWRNEDLLRAALAEDRAELLSQS